MSFKLVVNYIRNFLVRRHSMRKRKKNRIDGNFEVMIWIISFQYKRLQFGISPTIFLLKKKRIHFHCITVSQTSKSFSTKYIYQTGTTTTQITKVIVWFKRIFTFKDQKKKKKIRILKKNELQDNKTAKTRKTQITKNKITTKRKTPQPHTKYPIFYQKKKNENKRQ